MTGLPAAGNRYKAFTRRTVLLGASQGLLMSVLAGRLYYLQVTRADQYRTLADENRISLRLLPPTRGRILDRATVELANNQQNFRVLLVPEHATGGIAKTLDVLSTLVEIDSRDRRRIEREIKRNRKFIPVTVLENLSWDEFSRVNVHLPDLPGIQPDVGESRFYPLGNAFAHLVGYVGVVSKEETTGEPLLELPGFRVGKSGVERAKEGTLRGAAGNSQVEVNALGRVIKQLKRNEGVPGGDIVLTLDSDLQMFAADRLGENSGSVVVMDVHTGDILAMVSTPGFNPNAFNLGIDHNEWRELINNPRKPLINKSIRGQYPPGSTFKMIVALAAIESGVVGTDHKVYCSGKIKLGNHTFHCWKKGGHGTLDTTGALQHSCDIHFYDLAKRVGVDRIAEMAKRFGLGSRAGIGIGGERGGLIPTKAWKLATIGERWQVGETLNTGIGQGFVLTTPLQLATMAAQIANGGYQVRPQLIHSPHDATAEPVTEPKSLGLTPVGLALVQDGMYQVSNSPQGTAYRSRIKEPGMEMAGKTGTAQVRRISKAERETRVRKNEEKPWIERDHALFVGYAPVAAPRYAVAVVVEHGGGGSTVAAPIARDVLREVQQRDPSRTAPMGPVATKNRAADEGEG